MNTQIPCKNQIDLSSESIIPKRDSTNLNQLSYILYPRLFSTRSSVNHQFSRVVVSSSQNCSNNGMMNSNGKCICWPGFGGVNCEHSCPSGYFGSDCQLSCPNSDCSGYLICAQDPIGCQCGNGLESGSSECTIPCENDKWGPDCLRECSHCKTRKSQSYLNIYSHINSYNFFLRSM